MLNSITLRDFRAFRREEFHFSKINILAGKNNSGKSSVLSAINLLAQTAIEREVGGSPLVLNGQYDQLGTFIDAVHGNIARRPIGIDISYGNFSLALDFKYRTQRRQIDLQRFDLRENGKEIYRYLSRKDAFESRAHGREVEKYFGISRKTRPIFRNFWPITVAPLGEILRVEPRHSATRSYRARYAHFSRQLAEASSLLESQFSNFESLSAFRDKPSRTYLYTGETARNVGVSGSNTAQILAQDAAQRGVDKGSLAESISRWFRQSITEIGNFDPSWPGGFFPQRAVETTNVARSALRRHPELQQRKSKK